MRTYLAALAALLAATVSMPAGAIDSSYSGFATLGYAQTDTDKAAVGYAGAPEGIDSDGRFATDSKLGFQFTSTFNSMFSATVQAVAYEDLTSTWEPRLDWAYLTIKPVQSLRVRLGYLRAPTFMFSDSVFIGYANTWVRPPLEVYNLTAVYQLRGGDVTWSNNFGEVGVSLTGFYGNTDVDSGRGEFKGHAEDKDWTGLVASVQSGSFSARAAYSQFTINTSAGFLDQIADALAAVPSAFCGACAGFAKSITPRGGKDFKVIDAGGQYDNGKEIAIAEYARVQSEWSLIPDAHSMYLTLGRRFGSFMPYATYAKYTIDSSNSVAGITVPQLAAVVGSFLSSQTDQESYSAGLSYQIPPVPLIKGAVVKLQYDHIDTTHGTLPVVLPGFDGKVDLYSLSLDMLF